MSSEPAKAYHQGLRDILDSGWEVPSVLGAKSKASNFGRGDRPWIELLSYRFSVQNEKPFILSSPKLRTHVPYAIGLLAWTLDGRNDLESLSYYRKSAKDFSDDGKVMCGAFGARLLGINRSENQIQAIITRMRGDPSSRRTYASIISPGDNISETREYPCAAGVQLFLRNEKLHWLTVMRAQQALTILPYDLSLFSMFQHFVASELGVNVGLYIHFSGTFHIYANERNLAQQVLRTPVDAITFPELPRGYGQKVAQELIKTERDIRHASMVEDLQRLEILSVEPVEWSFNRMARDILVQFGRVRAESSAELRSKCHG